MLATIDPTVVTVASIPAIVAVVNLCKRLGLSAKGALLLAVVLGVAFSVGQSFLGDTEGWQAASAGLILGLGAAGIYDMTPGTGTPSDPPADLPGA